MTPRRIYAIKFKDGIVKVGITSNVAARFDLIRNINCKGKVIESYAFSPKMEYVDYAVEKIALTAMRRLFTTAKGREFFFCNDFDAALKAIKRAHENYAPINSAGWRVFYGISTYSRGSKRHENISLNVESIRSAPMF